MKELKCLDERKSFYKKAMVDEKNNGEKVLYSYGTPVCRISASGKIERLWIGYSLTTMRHVNSFLKTYGFNFGGKSWWDKQEVVQK